MVAVYMQSEVSGSKIYASEANVATATWSQPQALPTYAKINYGPMMSLASDHSGLGLARWGTAGWMKATWISTGDSSEPGVYVQSKRSPDTGAWSNPEVWQTRTADAGAVVVAEAANGWSVVGVGQKTAAATSYELVYQVTSPSGSLSEGRIPLLLNSARIVWSGVKLAISAQGLVSVTWIDGLKLRAQVQSATGWSNPLELGDIGSITIQRPEPNVSLKRSDNDVTAVAWSGAGREICAVAIDAQAREIARKSYLIRERNLSPDIAPLSDGRFMLGFVSASPAGDFFEPKAVIYTPAAGWGEAIALTGAPMAGYWNRLYTTPSGDVAVFANQAHLNHGIVSPANPAAARFITAIWSNDRYAIGYDPTTGRAVVVSPVGQLLKTNFLK
jgi:hypothetical protein